MVRLLHLFKARKSSSLIFGMFLMVAMLTTAMRPAMAQTLTPSDFTCTYDTKPFTCDGGNGAIIFNVVTVFGDTLHFDNDGNCSFPGGSCVSGAFRYRRHGSDTIYTSHSNEVTGMNHGVYDVTWAAQYQPEGSSSFISIGYSSNTWDVVTIDSLYSPCAPRWTREGTE